jgi:cbb3-type cytochrome oxidase subunit 3
LISAIGKLSLVLQESKFLDSHSPLISLLSLREIMFIACLIEIFTIFILSYSKLSEFESVLVILWLSLLFIGYRVAMWASGFVSNCNCFGDLPETLGFTPREADFIATIVLIYFFLGSTMIILFYNQLKGRKVQKESVINK